MLNFLIKLKIKRYEGIPVSNLINQINQEIVKQTKYSIDDNEIGVSLFENILIKTINKRCEDLNSTKSYIKTDNNLKVKLFGDFNYFYDNSKWVQIKKKNELNEDLKLKDDLNFSESHIYSIIYEHFEFFEINNENINKLIIPIIRKSKLETVRDIRQLIDSIFYKNNNI